MQSDLTILRMSSIIARAKDYRDSAVRQGDALLVERIDRLIRDKLPHARLCWQLGALIVRSPSGNTYRVTNAGCSCLNGQKSRRRECWHALVHEILLDLFATDCDTADMAADPPGDNPMGDDEGDTLPRARSLGARLATARSQYAYL